MTNDNKVGAILTKVMKLLNKNNMTIPELIMFYGNLGYHVGASIAGYQGTGPSLEELKKLYYSNPTVDVGLMLQGLLITSWEEDYIKKPILSEKAQENRKEKSK
jgi:hypothetical protein